MNIGKTLSGWVGGLLAALAVIVIGLLVWWFVGTRGEDVAADMPPAEIAAVPAQVGTDEAGTEAPEPAPQAEAEAAAPVEPAEPGAAAPLSPSFDVVRIKPDGSALVAGRAEPGAKVSVLVEGAPVAAAEADTGAGFVAMFDLPPIGIDRVMTLEAVLDDGTRLTSEMNVIVEGVEMPQIAAVAEPPAAPEPAPAPAPEPSSAPEPEAVPGAATDSAGTAPETAATPPETAAAVAQPDAPAAMEAPETATPETAAPEIAALEPAPAEPAPAPEAPAAPEGIEPTAEAPVEPAPQLAAPRILLAGPDGVRVLQDAGPNPQLSIDAISYDAAGEVALSGRGQGENTLRIYLDNAPVGTVEVGPEGQWRAPLPDIDAGVYTLRVDAVTPEGNVTSRVETPFKREEHAVLAAAGEKAAAAAAEGRTLSAVTVQPGHTLWAIAEGRYGEGIKYWTVFNANRDQIRNPDLIYPGQVFTLPDEAE